jgi:hypothetical protein
MVKYHIIKRRSQTGKDSFCVETNQLMGFGVQEGRWYSARHYLSGGIWKYDNLEDAKEAIHVAMHGKLDPQSEGEVVWRSYINPEA